MNHKCRLCEREIKWSVYPLDGLCSDCHQALCSQGPEKCSRCAAIDSGMVDNINESDEENDYKGKD